MQGMQGMHMQGVSLVPHLHEHGELFDLIQNVAMTETSSLGLTGGTGGVH
jgi:hypothetical protein